MSSRHYLSQRLSFSSQVCTVRFIGQVRGTKGDWLGVEWDDPSRGKHDGEHDGVRYFWCQRKHPTVASFVRPNRPNDPPLSFLEALRQKYAPETSAMGGADPSSGHASLQPHKPIELGNKIVEEVGFEGIRQRQAMLHDLRIALLDGCRVAGLTGNASERDQQKRRRAMAEIREVCPNITELDLSGNLLEDWDEVVGICTQLDLPKSLRVNRNRMLLLADHNENLEAEAKLAFAEIEELELDETFLSWNKINTITSLFTSLSSLSTSSNQLSTLTSALSTRTVTTMILENNCFTSLLDISALSELPQLGKLCLGHNQIASIVSTSDRPNNDESFQFGPSVTDVDLSYNAIDDWHFIDDLPNVFPGLTSLRINHNPLYEAGMGVEEGFMLTVARLPRLQTLNFSSITPPERTNAEMYYLSRVAHELESDAESEEAKILARHPRYEALCRCACSRATVASFLQHSPQNWSVLSINLVHGAPTITRKSANDVDPNSLEARLINFTFRFTPRSDLTPATPDPIVKTQRLPRSWDIYRVKGYVGRLFDVKPLKTRLIWETDEWDPVGDEEGGDDNDDDWEALEEEGGGDDHAGAGGVPKETWVRREVELLDGTRDVGYWVEGREARVRVELR